MSNLQHSGQSVVCKLLSHNGSGPAHLSFRKNSQVYLGALPYAVAAEGEAAAMLCKGQLPPEDRCT